MIRLRALVAAILLVCPSLVRAQADPSTIQRIVDEGKNRNQVMSDLTYLTTKIGPRLTSSPQLDRAYAWTQKKFKEFGCKNVHLEEWGEFPLGFERGKVQVGRMVAPEKIDFEFTTPSWTVGTAGLVRGRALYAPMTTDELAKVKDQLKGAWLISKGAARRTELPDDVTTALKNAGIAGTIYGSNSDLVITFGRWKVARDELPKTPQIIVRKKDMDAIVAALDAGKPVELEFNLDNRFIRGPRKNYNVVAEIPGTEKPDEVVIVSGHLDSWDGPGSQGAQDNGTGSMVTLEAARILSAAHAKPRRTIRFILWTGEEEGLFGSAAYVKKHADELPKISCVLVDDGGTNYLSGLTCTPDMEPILTEAIAPASAAFPDLPMSIRTAPRLGRGGGSDHASFNEVGVPGFFWRQSGTANYGFIHHTQHDRLETVVPAYVVQASTNSAAAAYVIACAPTLLPRPAPTPAGTTP